MIEVRNLATYLIGTAERPSNGHLLDRAQTLESKEVGRTTRVDTQAALGTSKAKGNSE